MNTAAALLRELRADLASIYFLASEHIENADDAICTTRDARALDFLDRCATIIHDPRPPLHERLRLLTDLLEPLERPGAQVAPDSEIIVQEQIR